MHYNAIGTETTDQSTIGFRFARTAVHTQVNTTIVLNSNIVPPMVQKHEVIGVYQFRPRRGSTACARTCTCARSWERRRSVRPDGSRSVLLHIPGNRNESEPIQIPAKRLFAGR